MESIVVNTEIAIFGAGAWGTALGIHLANNGHPTTLWSHRSADIPDIVRTKINQRYLPDIRFPDNLDVTDCLEKVAAIPNWLLAIPSHAFTEVFTQAWRFGAQPKHILWATKGLCSKSGRLLHQVVQQIVGQVQPVALLSGPSFAREVALGMPTAVTIAASDGAESDFWASCFACKTFNVYTSKDIIGVQVGGAVKNIIALAAGMSDGLGYGANARCALITRGLAEISALATTLGADLQTSLGLSGVGDLILTCTDNQSRNRRCGYRLGQGETYTEIQQSIGQVIEGVSAVEQVSQLAQALKLNMPITQMLMMILKGQKTPAAAFNDFFAQDPMPE